MKPTAEGKRIGFDGDARTVIDGPFAEAREVTDGFSIWEVRDMDGAVAWAKRSPNPMAGRSEVEIRPFLEAEGLVPDAGGAGGAAGWRAREAGDRLTPAIGGNTLRRKQKGGPCGPPL